MVKRWDLVPAIVGIALLAFYGRIELHELGHAIALLPGMQLGLVDDIRVQTGLLTGVTIYHVGSPLPAWYDWIVSAAGVFTLGGLAILMTKHVARARRWMFEPRRLWLMLGFVWFLSGLWDLAPVNPASDGAAMARATSVEMQWVVWWLYAAGLVILALAVFRDKPAPVGGVRWAR